jgi:hypothetical protein
MVYLIFTEFIQYVNSFILIFTEFTQYKNSSILIHSYFVLSPLFLTPCLTSMIVPTMKAKLHFVTMMTMMIT